MLTYIRNLIEVVNMISQVQTASASIGKPVSPRKAYRILFPKVQGR
jgi:hypothetical protein